MMKKIYIVYLLGWMITHTACENQIDLNSEERVPKLIMNALINSDSINNVLSLSLTGPYQIAPVTDCTVEIQVNGNLVETAEKLSSGEGYDKQSKYRIAYRFHHGDVIRIDARTIDGKYHAWAEVTVPQPVSVLHVDTLTVTKKLLGRYTEAMRYKITLKDRPNEKNFYRVIVERNDTMLINYDFEPQILTVRNSELFTQEDVVLTDGRLMPSDEIDMFSQPMNVYGVFDDHRFTDKEYTMTVFTRDIATDSMYYYDSSTIEWLRSKINIRLLSINEVQYYYLKLLNVIDSGSYDEILNDPISFPSNVNGGTGIVGISAERSVTIYRHTSKN